MPRLVLIYGPGSGLGKTTIARDLQRLLSTETRTVRLLLEEDVEETTALAPYATAVRSGHGRDPQLLLTCIESLVAEIAASDAVWIIDSVLPGFDWLASAGCSARELEAFANAVEVLLAPLSPVTIHVRGDVRAGLARAMADRGAGWARRLAERRTGASDVDALVSYFEELQAVTERLFGRWRGEVIHVNTTSERETETLETVRGRFAPDR